mgnify:CR=1 FL=1
MKKGELYKTNVGTYVLIIDIDESGKILVRLCKGDIPIKQLKI